ARVARRVIQAGRKATGRNDIRCTVSIGGVVPQPPPPLPTAPPGGPPTPGAPPPPPGPGPRAGPAPRPGPGGRAPPPRPAPRRVGAVIRAVWQDGGRFDGWSEYFSYDRWVRCAAGALAGSGVDLDWYTTRERGYDEILPWDHLDSGLDRDWLWQDWQDAIDPA